MDLQIAKFKAVSYSHLKMLRGIADELVEYWDFIYLDCHQYIIVFALLEPRPSHG